MSSRSRAVVFIAAIAACLVMAGCVSLLIGGYWLVTSGRTFSLSAPEALNRIVYVGNDLNIYVASPVTGDKTQITHDGGDAHAYNYPAWSPDNRRLAFVGYTFQDGSPTEGTLYTTSPGGDRLTAIYHAKENFPFYLYWSPDSRVVGFLSNKTDQLLALRIARSDEQDSMQELDTGSPLYWAWSPDSSEMFTHVGGTRADSDEARLMLLPFRPTDPRHALTASPGEFQAPQWSRDGKLLFSTQKDSGGAVAISNAQGGEVKELFQYDGRVSFGLAPDGAQVAYIVTENDVRLTHYGVVHVMDTTGGAARFTSADRGLAFFWSPDGKQLAFLTASVDQNPSNFNGDAAPGSLASNAPHRFPGPSSPEQGGTTRVQLNWEVWDRATNSVRKIATFLPTASFLGMIPFFDQYANSATFWSPDSRAFVYTTRDNDTTASVWIADVTGQNAPRKVGEGSIAYWSWK